MTEEGWTSLRCSRCETIIVSMPGEIDMAGTIGVELALDLVRACIQHGYICPGRQA